MRRSLLLCALVALCFPAAAGAQNEDTGLVKGRTEYNLSGDFQLKSPTSSFISARYAPMVTDRWQLGLDVSYLDASGSAGFIGGIVNYYFPASGKLIPYVGGAVGTTFGDVGSHSSWGLQVGAKHFLSPNAALGAEYQYRRMESQDTHQIVLGMSYFGGPNPLTQDFKTPDRGTKQYSVDGLIHFNPDTQMFSASYAPWVNRNLQWGGEFSINHANDFTDGFIGGVVNWHFPGNEGGRVQPYVGARIGTFFGDTDDGLAYDLHVGALVFLAPDVAFDPEFSYGWIDPPGGTRQNAQIRFGLVYLYP